jgi:hypothetical protein
VTGTQGPPAPPPAPVDRVINDAERKKMAAFIDKNNVPPKDIKYTLKVSATGYVDCVDIDKQPSMKQPWVLRQRGEVEGDAGRPDRELFERQAGERREIGDLGRTEAEAREVTEPRERGEVAYVPRARHRLRDEASLAPVRLSCQISKGNCALSHYLYSNTSGSPLRGQPAYLATWDESRFVRPIRSGAPGDG